jgi:hypothetical protein
MMFSASYIMAVSFIGGGNRTWRKPPTCRKSLTNFIFCQFEDYFINTKTELPNLE